MNHFAPKLLTGGGGASIVKNKDFNFAGAPARSHSFLDRTVAARRPEKTFESATGIIPGDRGKVGDSWCRPPLRRGASRCGRQISPAPLIRSRVRSVYTNQELSGERRLETAREPSQAHREFRPVRRRSYPRGFWLLLRRPERSCVSRRDDPAKRPRSHEPGAQGRRDCGERASLAKLANLLDWGGPKNGSPHCKSESNLRVKRSDP